MIKRTAVILLLILMVMPIQAHAETTIDSVADMFGLTKADSGLKSIGEEYGMEDFSLRDTAVKIVTG